MEEEDGGLRKKMPGEGRKCMVEEKNARCRRKIPCGEEYAR